jgi:hypothetical protein
MKNTRTKGCHHLTTKEELFSQSNELLMHAFVETGLRKGKKVVILADKNIREWMEAAKLMSFILPDVTLKAMPIDRKGAINFGRGMTDLHVLVVSTRPAALIQDLVMSAAPCFNANILVVHTDPM